jgi:type IV secretion system protein VirB11
MDHIEEDREYAAKLEIFLPRAVLGLFADDDVSEVYCNPDAIVRVDGRGGRRATGIILSAAKVGGFLNVVASREGHALGGTLGSGKGTERSWELAAELPRCLFNGARLQAWVPPVTVSPVVTIRKRPSRLFLLDDLVALGTMTPAQDETVREAVLASKTLVVSGGTGAGKTSFLAAVLDELRTTFPLRRFLILEDTPEILIVDGEGKAKDVLFARTTPGMSLEQLVVGSMRSHPDHIVVGEVRTRETAYSTLDAMVTGHQGGLWTVHASSCRGALRRLARLAGLAGREGLGVHELVAEAVGLVVQLAGGSEGRRVVEIAAVEGWRDDDFLLRTVGF